MSGLLEKDVGMTEYLSDHMGFSGILKLRYQDFMVNEIDRKGNILRLTNLEHIVNDEKDELEKSCTMETVISNDVLSEGLQAQLRELMANSASQPSVIINAGDDKAKRTQIHQTIREHFPHLDSETISNADTNKKTIKITHKTNKNGRKRRFDRSQNKKTTLSFLLYKENISTMDAINVIMKKIHLKHSKCIQFAGNKDKRAVTVQEMTTSLPSQRILSINRLFQNIKVGNISECQYSLQLGDLSGNHFSITLRDVKSVTEDDVKTAVSSFQRVGFINYFGMQRFGTCKAATYEIGKCLLASRWADAVDLILSSISHDDKEALELAKGWREGHNACEAHKKLRRKSSFEGFLLQGIAQYGAKQLVQSLNRIPRPTRLLYLHSYQSYVWNRVASRRIRSFGLEPVEGDLVLVDGTTSIVKDDKTDVDKPKKQKLDSETNSAACTGGRKRAVGEVKILSSGDLSSYSIYDVVLPLPGYDVTYPSNATCWYNEIFADDVMDTSCFDHKVKDYAISGAYRKIVAKPNHVDWSLVRYSDFTKPLLVSDFDKIRGRSETGVTESGEHRALLIHFSLPSSSYASVAIRELTKSDLSVSNQAALGELHKAGPQAS